MKIFFFGCGTQAGHYLFKPGLRHTRDEQTPWGRTPDLTLIPHDSDCRFVRDSSRYHCDCPQVEGAAAIHHKDGWTAIGFCDRSVDTRCGCNGNFLVEAPGLTFEQMLDLARQHFPTVMARFKFPIVLKKPLETPLAASNYRETLSPELTAAAERVLALMTGISASEIWALNGRPYDEAVEQRDYALIATQWRWLHPTSTLLAADAAKSWTQHFYDLFGE